MTDVEVPAGADPAAEVVAAVRGVLDRDGYVVLPGAVPGDAVDVVVRRLNMAIRHHGLTADEIAEWQTTGFFPHLRWEPEVWGVLPPSAPELLGWEEGDQWGDPQLLLRFPDDAGADPPLRHPSWTADRSYRGIVCVALTTAGPADESAYVWPRSHLGEVHARTPVPLTAGDALVMLPGLGHTPTLNLGPAVRMAVYFRLVAGAAA